MFTSLCIFFSSEIWLSFNCSSQTIKIAFRNVKHLTKMCRILCSARHSHQYSFHSWSSVNRYLSILVICAHKCTLNDTIRNPLTRHLVESSKPRRITADCVRLKEKQNEYNCLAAQKWQSMICGCWACVFESKSMLGFAIVQWTLDDCCRLCKWVSFNAHFTWIMRRRSLLLCERKPKVVKMML